MSDSLMVVSTSGEMAVAKEIGTGYRITSPLTGGKQDLVRDVDFGVVPGTKKPSLYKSGAEKVIMAYGLMVRYSIESKMEEYDTKGNGFFYYLVKCSLYKGFTNTQTGEYQEVEFANGYASANTLEKRNGSNSAFNSSNSTLKMAEKRALVQAALAVSGLSSMFSQDMEDETAVKAGDMLNQKPDSRINAKQRERMFAVAAQAGMTVEEFKRWLIAEGMPKTTEITVEQFEGILEKLKTIGKGESNG